MKYDFATTISDFLYVPWGSCVHIVWIFSLNPEKGIDQSIARLALEKYGPLLGINHRKFWKSD